MENSPKTSQSICLLPLSPSQPGNISIRCSISSACHQAWYPFLFSSTPTPHPAHFIKAQLKYSELQIISAAEMPRIGTFSTCPLWKDVGSRVNLSPYFFLRMAYALLYVLDFELLHVNIFELGLKQFKTYLLIDLLHRGGSGAWETVWLYHIFQSFPSCSSFSGQSYVRPIWQGKWDHNVSSWQEHEWLSLLNPTFITEKVDVGKLSCISLNQYFISSLPPATLPALISLPQAQSWTGDFHDANQDHLAVCPGFDLLPEEGAGRECHGPGPCSPTAYLLPWERWSPCKDFPFLCVEK